MIAEGFGYESFEINCSVLLSKAAGLSSGFRDGCLEGKKKRLRYLGRQLSLASVAVRWLNSLVGLENLNASLHS